MPINRSQGIKSIQRGVATIAASNTFVNVTISAVNTAKSEVRMLGFTGNGGAAPLDTAIPRLYLNSSTQVGAIRTGSGVTTIDVTYEVTEWY